jgi:hypothetical protein
MMFPWFEYCSNIVSALIPVLPQTFASPLPSVRRNFAEDLRPLGGRIEHFDQLAGPDRLALMLCIRRSG